jgi:hypothetical protein
MHAAFAVCMFAWICVAGSRAGLYDSFLQEGSQGCVIQGEVRLPGWLQSWGCTLRGLGIYCVLSSTLLLHVRTAGVDKLLLGQIRAACWLCLLCCCLAIVPCY